MSKRMSTTKLDHENWDVEEPPEEAGTFSSATTDVLKKRTILKAQRRSKVTGSGESGTPAVPNIFQNIKLTGTSAAPSFSFLSKNEKENTKTENLLSKPQPSFVFSSTTASTQASDKTGENKFSFGLSKTTPVSESSSGTAVLKPDTSSSLTTSKSKSPSPAVEAATTAPSSSSVFGNKAAFASNGTASTVDNSKPVAPPPQTFFGNVFGNSVSKSSVEKSEENRTDTGQISLVSGDKKNDVPGDSKKLSSTENANKKADSPSPNSFIDKDKYYLMLKGLNGSVAKWIKENVEKNPHCILTPIFSDYITHLNDIKAKYGKVKAGSSEKNENASSVVSSSSHSQDETKATVPSNTFMVNGSDKHKSTSFLLPLPQSFTPLSQSATPTPQASSEKPQVSAPFSFSTFASQKTFPKPDTSTQSSLFAIDKSAGPASSSSNTEAVAESTTGKTEENNEDDDAEPPEPAPTPVVEEGAVYSQRCKVFVKKSGSYQDRGVGTIYIKPVVDNTKTQLIVRADTVLGNVLLNTLIISSLPIQRLGPNNVMVVCVPTPDEKPPPATVLLRVKTAADADELYEKLVSYKK